MGPILAAIAVKVRSDGPVELFQMSRAAAALRHGAGARCGGCKAKQDFLVHDARRGF